jgi:hypothetical protein
MKKNLHYLSLMLLLILSACKKENLINKKIDGNWRVSNVQFIDPGLNIPTLISISYGEEAQFTFTKFDDHEGMFTFYFPSRTVEYTYPWAQAIYSVDNTVTSYVEYSSGTFSAYTLTGLYQISGSTISFSDVSIDGYPYDASVFLKTWNVTEWSKNSITVEKDANKAVLTKIE